MLHENIKANRKAKGLSQQELADRLHVVRQTVSKWEQGLSVPDADLLLALSEVLETPVSCLLGQTVEAAKTDPASKTTQANEIAFSPQEDLQAIAEKLEAINLQLAHRKTVGRRLLHGLFIVLCAGLVLTFAVLAVSGSPYLGWDRSEAETAVAGAIAHGGEWLFVRFAPFLLLGALLGAVLTRKKR